MYVILFSTNKCTKNISPAAHSEILVFVTSCIMTVFGLVKIIDLLLHLEIPFNPFMIFRKLVFA